MHKGLRRAFVGSLLLAALVAVAPAPPVVGDEGGDPFPCNPVCVPVPFFPFIICAPDPGCGGGGTPGPFLIEEFGLSSCRETPVWMQ